MDNQTLGQVPLNKEPAVAELKANSSLQQEQPTDSFFNFDFAKVRFDKLIENWELIVTDTERNRLLRYIKTDEKTLQTLKLFKEDETYVAVRLMDQNIRAEQPQRLAYITQPRRAVVLKPLYSERVNGVENVEAVFTDCARYQSWENPFIKVDDGASSHGWDFVEVVFDETKPGHFAVEHVGRENLIFDLDAEDITNQECLIRRVKVTSSRLIAWIEEFGFDPIEVNKLVESDDKTENKTKDTTHVVYKVYFRYKSTIYVCWHGGKSAGGYLKKPVGFYLGINDLTLPTKPRLAEVAYPFFQLDYIETEAPKVIDKHGRCFLDEPAQSAASAILSGIVNSTMRASNVYGAVAPSPVPSADTTPPKQTNVKLKHGLIYDKPLIFFSTPFPPASALQSLELVTQYNKLDISRPDYAVKNRKDSRKTATEVQASVNDASMMASVQSTQQSVFMRKVYTKCFEIFQNRSLQGVIPVPDNIKQMLAIKFDVKAAGDVDVIQRQEKLVKQQQTWPVVANTPIAMDFLKDFLMNAFPEEAPRYIQILQQDQQAKQLVAGLAQALKVAVTDESGQIKPEYNDDKEELQQLGQQVQMFLNPQNEGEQSNAPATAAT